MEVVHSWRVELGLRVYCAKVQHVDRRIEKRPLVIKVFLLLLALVLTHETCLKDTRRDTHLELILLYLVVVEGHYGHALAFLLLTIRAKVPYARFILIQTEAVLLRRLVSPDVILS